MAPMPNGTPAAVEADQMSYDGGTGMVAAEGAAVMSYDGYTLRADKIEYDQAKGSVRAVGHVVLRDPNGDVLTMDSIEVTGGMKEAFLNSLTVTTSEGAVIERPQRRFQIRPRDRPDRRQLFALRPVHRQQGPQGRLEGQGGQDHL